MEEYRISREDLEQWCKIPMEQLENHPDSKVKVVIRPTRQEIMELAGNMMADEVKLNNSLGKPTSWVLPSGPSDQFKTFANRVNKERISLKNLTIFHMDYVLDWNSREFPYGDYYESAKGRMDASFFALIDDELQNPKERRFWPRLADLDEMDNEIEKIGGVDTVWAGVGYKGLVAFCESPHNPYLRVTLDQYANMKTRVVTLNDDTIIATSERSFGGLYDRCPHQAVTIGMKSMLSAKRCVMMIPTGAWKQTVVRVVMFAEPTIEYPVTLFPKYVPECILLTDSFTATHPYSKGKIVLSAENTTPNH